MADHRVKLVPSISAYTDDRLSGTRLKVVVSESVNMDREIFAYRAIPLQPGDPNDPQTAVFSHICSPVDLEEFPIGAPRPDAVPAWFRLDTVDVLFRSRGQAIRAWDSIREVAENLGLSLTRQDALESLSPLWVGDPAPSPFTSAFGITRAPLPISTGRAWNLPAPHAHGPSTTPLPVSHGLIVNL